MDIPSIVQRFILLSWIVQYVVASSYNVYNYDLSTPIFTPDGLLKQVEYASLSATHSSPMLVISSHFNQDPNGFFLLVATRKDYKKNEVAENHVSHHNLHRIPYLQQGQSRIIPIPIRDQNNSCILIGTSGVLPDAVSLVEIGRNAIHSIQSAYGIKTMDPISCAREVAECIANKCEEHALGGGLRPYGAEIFVCSLTNRKDPHNTTSMKEDAVIYIAQPSGALYEHHFKGSDSIHRDVFVFGGDEKNKFKLHQKVVEKLKLYKQDTQTRATSNVHESVKYAVRAAISALVETRNSEQPIFDIVIFDSEEGFIRLSQDDIQRIANETK